MSPSDLDTVWWEDASLDGVSLDYDRVVIAVTETTGRKVRLICDGHIGRSLEAFWDETVVAAASLVPVHPFGDRCELRLRERYGDALPESGSPDRNAGHFSTLVLSLIDGIDLLCCAARFTVEEQAGAS